MIKGTLTLFLLILGILGVPACTTNGNGDVRSTQHNKPENLNRIIRPQLSKACFDYGDHCSRDEPNLKLLEFHVANLILNQQVEPIFYSNVSNIFNG